MASFDLHSDVFAVVAKNTAAITSSTTTVGAIIDTQGYEGLEFIIQSGARTDGTYTPLLEESDAADLSGSNQVADEDLVGLEASAAISAANTVKRLGYVGGKRYVRLSIVSTGVTSGATIGATAILGRPAVSPAPAN
jgi:hypothetical protein